MCGLLCLVLGAGLVSSDNHEKSVEAERMLQGFVDDYRNDPSAEGVEASFGITIRDVGEWHVEAKGAETELKQGAVPVAAPFFITDMETLGRIDRGELSIMTSMGRERMSDQTPMNFGFANGFQLTMESMAELLPLTFHFWTKGQPEIVKFGELDQARVVHGAWATVMYYQQGFRSSYYRIDKGQHINAEEEMQANPFPSLFILIGGVMDCRIGGKEMTLEGKQAILVPAGVPHEFWNTHEVPVEMILIMFGEGA
jgi:mannose-6-phosphate isomerase-like protein (cupin superfamily)